MDRIAREQAAAAVRSHLAKPTSVITLSFHQIEGFLFAVSSAPEFVEPSEWIGFLLGSETPAFLDEDEGTAFLGAVLQLHDAVNAAINEGHAWTAKSAGFRGEPMSNLAPDAPIHQWSKGFTLGLGWLFGVWEYAREALEDSDPEAAAELSLAQLILCYFANRSIEAIVNETVDHAPVDPEGLARLAMKTFDDSMNLVARMGRLFSELDEPEDLPPISWDDVGRNDPCPCGSGRKYKKCCGAA